MSKKRSLADELAELFNPAPTKEFDPDADPFGAGPALVESDEELALQQQSGRRAKEKAMRLRGDIELAGIQYKGRRTSRGAMFGSSTESEGGSSDGDDGEGKHGSDEEGEESLEDDGPHVNGFGRDEAGGTLEAGSDGDSEDEMSGGEESDGDGQLEFDNDGGVAGAVGSEESEGREASPGQSDFEDLSGDDEHARQRAAEGADDEGGELAALEREYEAMRVVEAEAAAGLRERAAKERQKALAVRAQQQLWQRGLEMRILLQRALQGANKLPQAPMRDAAATHSAHLQAAYDGVVSEAVGLAEDLAQLVNALHQQNAAVSEAAVEAQVGEKRRRQDSEQHSVSQELWEEVDDLYSSFAPFRVASIDRWHRKTTLTTGGAVKSSLKALNQSVSSQVAAMMRDPHKLMQRTRMPRIHSSSLCAPIHAQGDTAPADVTEPGPASYDGDDERDPETFDDTEFYQTLLKEFLESTGTSGGDNWFSGPKHRKVVDRRASKGRKIRYHVHEKLVNFMTPVEFQGPQFAAQLFSNLFGGSRGAQTHAAGL